MLLKANMETIRSKMMVEIQIIKYRGFLLFIEGVSCVFCDSMSTGTFTAGGFKLETSSGQAITQKAWMNDELNRDTHLTLRA